MNLTNLPIKLNETQRMDLERSCFKAYQKSDSKISKIYFLNLTERLERSRDI
ncbi:MAG: hypothetical protein ACFFG0_09645 [Candidatus Thorarchaeota archaeon]